MPPCKWTIVKMLFVKRNWDFIYNLITVEFRDGKQRWSRGHKALGQGHKKHPRPRTAFPRTDPLEAKDRNARSQGPRTQPQVVFKKKKGLQKFFSGNLQFIGVAIIFYWGSLNHKSHAMTSSKICLLALNQDFAKGEGLYLYSWNMQIRNFGDVLRKPV